MVKSVTKILIACISIVLMTNVQISAQQIVRGDESEIICQSMPQSTARNTYVYIDLHSIGEKNLDWGLTILNKLELSPRESLTLLSVDSESGTVREEFTGCYPILTTSEIEAERAKRGWIDKLISFDPAEQNKENNDIFDLKIKNALNRIHGSKLKNIDSNRRSVLEAISLDKKRFGGNDSKIRVIIYSDMDDVLSSKIVQSKDIRATVDAIYESYPNNFYGGDVSVYGVKNDASDRMKLIQMAYEYYFQRSSSMLVSLSPTLAPQRLSSVVKVVKFEGLFRAEQSIGRQQIVLHVDDKQDTIFSGLTMISSSAEYWIPLKVSGSCSDAECSVKGTVLQNVPLTAEKPFFRKGDNFTMEISNGLGSGKIQPIGDEKFEVIGTNVEYELEFK